MGQARARSPYCNPSLLSQWPSPLHLILPGLSYSLKGKTNYSKWHFSSSWKGSIQSCLLPQALHVVCSQVTKKLCKHSKSLCSPMLPGTGHEALSFRNVSVTCHWGAQSFLSALSLLRHPRGLYSKLQAGGAVSSKVCLPHAHVGAPHSHKQTDSAFIGFCS